MDALKRPSAATAGTSRLRLPDPGLPEAGWCRLWRLWGRPRFQSASYASWDALGMPIAEDGLMDALLEGLLGGRVSKRSSVLWPSLLLGRDNPEPCPTTEDISKEEKHFLLTMVHFE